METVYRLRADVTLTVEGASAVLSTERGPVRFTDLSAEQAQALQRLADGLAESDVAAAGSPATQVWLRMTLERLLTVGLLVRDLDDLARVEVLGEPYRVNARSLDPDRSVRLSRFALLRAEDGRTVLESPLATSRLVFTDWRGPAIVAALAEAGPTGDRAWPAGIDAQQARGLAVTLLREGMLEPGDGPLPGAAAEWSVHDLYFHSRSRQGRHRNPYGATYRFEGLRDPLPAVKQVPEDAVTVDLPRPDLDALRAGDPPFAEVVEARRSWRVPGPDPLTLAELGEFLFRCARVRGRRGTVHEEVSSRPYPGGGADYELEVYLLVNRVDGVARGLYHYDPLGHRLVYLSDWSPAVQALAVDTCRKAPPGQVPDVILTITARMLRLTYKYESIPYSVALKDLGVLMQTFYLAATAMGLAPCAIGGGNSDLFAAASGIPVYEEPQIGEFLLNTRNPAEAG